MDIASAKPERLLKLYSRLVSGEILNKQELAQQYQVTERSIQRDMESLRCFFADEGLKHTIYYDRKAKGYRMELDEDSSLSNCEILAVCKILLESRCLCKEEMFPLLRKLIACCVPQHNQKAINDLVANEAFHYVEPHHKKPILSDLWALGMAVQNHNLVELRYNRMKAPNSIQRKVKPVGLMFSEYYFYLAAFPADGEENTRPDDLYPTVYRVDRIQSYSVLSKRFMVPYRDRFQEGEFRKRVQFMYGGKLQRIQFKYVGPSIESVLDRLPTAQVLRKEDDGWLVSAEVYGDGILMWLLGQGPLVHVYSPEALTQELKDRICEMHNLYLTSPEE